MQVVSTPSKLPEMVDVTHLFAMLFGTGTACTMRRQSLDVKDSAVVAAYHDDQGQLKRLIVCDLAFANGAGAALTSIPPAIASKDTKTGVIADNLFENLHEVMNVAVNLFTEAFGGRLELESVAKNGELSREVQVALASDLRVRIDVTIPRYEVGRVDLVTVNSLLPGRIS